MHVELNPVPAFLLLSKHLIQVTWHISGSSVFPATHVILHVN